MKERGPLGIAVAAGFVTVLGGCSEPLINEGVLYDKQHIGEYTRKIPVLTNKKNRELKFVHTSYPETWTVKIAQCATKELPPEEQIEKECKTRSIPVTFEEFDALQIGQQVNIEKLNNQLNEQPSKPY